MVIRIIDSETSFKLTPSGKRDINALKEMQLDNTFRIAENGSLLSSYNKEDVKRKVLK